jgi:hypothetical protein
MFHFWVTFKLRITERAGDGAGVSFDRTPAGCVDGNTREEALGRVALICEGEVEAIAVLPFPAKPEIYAATSHLFFCQHPSACAGQASGCPFKNPCEAHKAQNEPKS